MVINQILEDLNGNLQELNTVENKIAMLQLALFQKSLENLRKDKLNEMKQYFEQQAKFYNQNIKDYQNNINEIIDDCNNQLKELINSYDYLYINFFKMMQEAINNQKISVGNIIILIEKLNKNDKITDEEKKKIKNNIIACAQKKLNYSVIIDECKARINWCIESAKQDIDEIFSNNMDQLQVYKSDIISKIRRKNLLYKKSYKYRNI